MAVIPLGEIISTSLGMSRATLQVTASLSAGAYAVGTLLAAQLAMHLPPRRMLIIYEVCFFVASILAAAAPNATVFIAAFIAQGLLTSLMLIAALPPLVTSWPVSKMPISAGLLNLCIFGAVAAGPTIGALQATGGSWRWLFWGVAGIAGLALLFSVLTFRDVPPQDPSAPWDFVALGLGVIGCGAAFYGAGQLQASMSADVQSIVPLAAGAALIAFLVVYEYRLPNPLVPVKQLATSVPLAGIFAALTASAAAIGATELLLTALHTSSKPSIIAQIFIPELVAAVAVAVLFALLFRTRFTPLLTAGGLLMVVASAALLIATFPTVSPALAVATGLLGLGVAAAVSPALFLAGLSLRSKMLQRVFALIELLRAVTAFLTAPILVFLAGTLSDDQATGTRGALWICLGIAAIGFVGATALYLSGRPRLETPDLERWQGRGEPAWETPPLFSALPRKRR
ncbi:MFS transporter [Plantactinospora soyae]|uniref:MFS family permease n=1 Tax=Plantactinospora soyae TaxID=1544732 RepID=A0A927M9V1_9ACTN|nr:MFS transporter [Plantactinospora soyae]MBE1490833.1 MFS family permease [Plantactinospora soyae]